MLRRWRAARVGREGTFAKFGRILDRCRIGVLQMLRRWGAAGAGREGTLPAYTLHLV